MDTLMLRASDCYLPWFWSSGSCSFAGIIPTLGTLEGNSSGFLNLFSLRESLIYFRSSLHFRFRNSGWNSSYVLGFNSLMKSCCKDDLLPFLYPSKPLDPAALCSSFFIYFGPAVASVLAVMVPMLIYCFPLSLASSGLAPVRLIGLLGRLFARAVSAT